MIKTMKEHDATLILFLLTGVVLLACLVLTKIFVVKEANTLSPSLSNPLLSVSWYDKDMSYKEASHFLVTLANLSQPYVNANFNLQAKDADFYIDCMRDVAYPRNACEMLFKRMALLASDKGKPYIGEGRDFMLLKQDEISSHLMWRVLSKDVIAINENQKIKKVNT